MTAHMRARVLIATLLIVLSLAATAALLGLQSTVAADRPQFDNTRGVLLSSRENLRVCVEPEPSDARGDAAANVRAALARLNGDERFRAAGYDKPPWQAAADCPAPGGLLASGQRHVKAGGTYATGPVVSHPSPFRLFVYVVPTSEIERMFGSLPFHFAGQEVFCQERQCATVTTALYVDADAIRNEDRLVTEIEQALGLRPVFPANPDRGNGPKEVR